MAKIIRTVLGDISPKDLGLAFMHEHLIIDSPIVKKDFSHIHLPSVEDAIAELLLCKSVGVGALLDCMPMGAGGNIRKLAEISAGTGLHVIAVTGMHHARYYESTNPLNFATSKELAEIFIGEIEVGSQGSEHRAGVIKVVTSGSEYSSHERTLFEAAAIAHSETGAPVITHCQDGRGAMEQISLLHSLQVPSSSIILSHTDKEPDFGYHRDILSSGVYLEYDQGLRQSKDANPKSVTLTREMIKAGFLSQIMMGTDGARRSLWQSLGGSPGLFFLNLGWRAKLQESGVSEQELHTIFNENPARALGFKELGKE